MARCIRRSKYWRCPNEAAKGYKKCKRCREVHKRYNDSIGGRATKKAYNYRYRESMTQEQKEKHSRAMRSWYESGGKEKLEEARARRLLYPSYLAKMQKCLEEACE